VADTRFAGLSAGGIRQRRCESKRAGRRRRRSSQELRLESEGEGVLSESPEPAELQALHSRAIDPWLDVHAGVRHDFRPDPERTHLVVGVQGLARYWFEVDGALFLSDKGVVTARQEAECDRRITNQLILQPAVGFNLAVRNMPELGIGSGLSTLRAGLRLRYQIVPEFAPCLGVEYEAIRIVAWNCVSAPRPAPDCSPRSGLRDRPGDEPRPTTQTQTIHRVPC
jgi:Copper resistance protein B precursor (CopB)